VEEGTASPWLAMVLGCGRELELVHPTGRMRPCQPLPAAPAAHQQRARLQARRLHAVELLALGVRQAEVARQLGVCAQAVSVWHASCKAGGTDALRSQGPTGPPPEVSDAQLGQVEQAC
jgi:transposase-like protein